MFRLPVCPHCRTVYSYGDVIKNRNKKEIACYHCKKKFRKGKRSRIIFYCAVLLITVLVNFLILKSGNDITASLIPVILVSVTAVLLAAILTPFFTDYIIIKNKDK